MTLRWDAGDAEITYALSHSNPMIQQMMSRFGGGGAGGGGMPDINAMMQDPQMREMARCVVFHFLFLRTSWLTPVCELLQEHDGRRWRCSRGGTRCRKRVGEHRWLVWDQRQQQHVLLSVLVSLCASVHIIRRVS